MIHHTNAPEPPSTGIAEMSFLVGRDTAGHWLAVETHGLGGGIFVNATAAIRYAEGVTTRRPGAVTLSDDLLQLHQAADALTKPRFLSSASGDGARPRKAR
jgi:hypothetical protein